MPLNTHAWSVSDKPTHETISLRAAQNGGNPNGGANYAGISAHSADPDFVDPPLQHFVKHTSIGTSTAIWTDANILSANLSFKWTCAKRVLGKCVWWNLVADRDERAKYIGRASHYFEDGGQPYHDHVVQILAGRRSAPASKGFIFGVLPELAGSFSLAGLRGREGRQRSF